MQHLPVMADEVRSAFAAMPADALLVDATFGRGGHSQVLLEALGGGGRVIALDRDEEAVRSGRSLAAADVRLELHQQEFAALDALLQRRLGTASAVLDGLLVDLGVSSPQLDDAERGMSFLHDGPLDMRMDQHTGRTAASFVNSASASELADCFFHNADERYSRRIAAAIVRAREHTPFSRTRELAEVVAAAHPRWPPNQHPATRVFQALRILVNDEFAQLDAVLGGSQRWLKIGGRIVVIAFHSGEDRRVKHAFRPQLVNRDPRLARLPQSTTERHALRALGRAIRPTAAEIARNPRARSAVLRIAERVA